MSGSGCTAAYAPEILRFAGATLTMPQLAESIGQLSSEKMGEVEELPALISSKTASPPFEWIALQHHHNMVSGRAKLEPLDARYPQVVPETVEEFSRRFVQANGSLGRRPNQGSGHRAHRVASVLREETRSVFVTGPLILLWRIPTA